MSLIASLNPASAAFPPINTHPHGHKHGSHVGSTDDANGASGQAPAGAVQNLFGSLLQSVEKVIGLQLGAAPSPAASTANAGTISTHSAKTLLQNYLNNLSHTQLPNGSQAARPEINAKV